MLTELPLPGTGLSFLQPPTPALPSRSTIFSKKPLLTDLLPPVRNSPRTFLCHVTHLLWFTPSSYWFIFVFQVPDIVLHMQGWSQCFWTEFNGTETVLNPHTSPSSPAPTPTLLLLVTLLTGETSREVCLFPTLPHPSVLYYGKIFWAKISCWQAVELLQTKSSEVSGAQQPLHCPHPAPCLEATTALSFVFVLFLLLSVELQINVCITKQYSI